MTSRSHIENAIRSLYAARVSGDLEGSIRDLAEEAVFSFNGRGIGQESLGKAAEGKAAIRPVLGQFVDNWRLTDWQERALLVDGEKAALHWTAKTTCLSTNKSESFEVLDLFTFRDGKIVDFRQSTDTALVLAVATP